MRLDWEFGILDDAVDKGSSNISLNKIKDDDGEFPVFGAKGFVQNVSFYQQENQYLAIIKDGAGIGRVSIHPEKSSVLATMQYILPKQSYDIKFLYYFLNSINFNKYMTGSTIPHIYYKNYKLEPFPLISKEEQKQIVAKLDQCFEAINKARANAAKNLENAKELFQSKLNDIFSQKGEDWVEKKLGDVCKFTRGPFGGSLKKSIFVDDGVAVYEQNHAIYNQFEKIRYFITNDKFEEMKRFELKPRDLIMSCSGTIGRTAIVPMHIKKGIINQALLKLSPGDSIISEYLKYWMESKDFNDQLLKSTKGAAVQNVASVKVLKEIVMPLCDIESQGNNIKFLDGLKEQTQSLESKYQQELNSLEELKKSVLQKAFEGEL